MPFRLPPIRQNPEQQYVQPSGQNVARRPQEFIERAKNLIRRQAPDHMPVAYNQAAGLRQAVANGKNLNGLRMSHQNAAEFKAALAKLAAKAAPSVSPNKVQLAQSPTLHSIGTQAACQAVLQELFPGGAAQALRTALLALPDPTPGTQDTAYNHAVLLAMHLRQACNADADIALSVLQNLAAPDPAAPAPVPERTYEVLRGLSRSPAGMAALWHLRQQTPPADTQRAEQRAWQICDWLKHQPGFDSLNGPGSLENFWDRAMTHPQVNQPLGQADDDALKLASKALIATYAELNGGPVTPDLQHAQLAWDRGFHTSGRGTPFNKDMKRLGKVPQFHQRALNARHTSLWRRPFQVLKGALQKTVGKNKPLVETMVRQGQRHAAASLLHVAGPRFRDGITQVLDGVGAHLGAKLGAMAGQLLTPPQEVEQVRLAVLHTLADLWATAGAKNVRIGIGDIMARCAELHPDVNVHDPAHLKLLQRLVPRGPLKLKHLEAMVVDLLLPNGANDPRQSTNRDLQTRLENADRRLDDIPGLLEQANQVITDLGAGPHNAADATQLNNALRARLNLPAEQESLQAERDCIQMIQQVRELRLLASGKTSRESQSTDLTEEDIFNAWNQLMQSGNQHQTQLGSTVVSLTNNEFKVGKPGDTVILKGLSGNQALVMDFIRALSRAPGQTPEQIWTLYATHFAGQAVSLSNTTPSTTQKLPGGGQLELSVAQDPLGNVLGSSTTLRTTFPDLPSFAAYLNVHRHAFDENFVFVNHEGQEFNGREALDQLFREAQLLPQHNLSFSIVSSLSPEVAEKINYLEGQKSALLGKGDIDQRTPLSAPLKQRLQDIEGMIQELFSNAATGAISQLEVVATRKNGAQSVKATVLEAVQRVDDAGSSDTASVAGSSDMDDLPPLEPDTPTAPEPAASFWNSLPTISNLTSWAMGRNPGG